MSTAGPQADLGLADTAWLGRVVLRCKLAFGTVGDEGRLMAPQRATVLR